MTSLRCIQAARVTDLLFGAAIKENNGYLQTRIVQWQYRSPLNFEAGSLFGVYCLNQEWFTHEDNRRFHHSTKKEV